MKPTTCGECGAVLRDRPDACPLCGTGVELGIEASEAPAPQDYQARVRALRSELKRLRDSGAEAV